MSKSLSEIVDDLKSRFETFKNKLTSDEIQYFLESFNKGAEKKYWLNYTRIISKIDDDGNLLVGTRRCESPCPVRLTDLEYNILASSGNLTTQRVTLANHVFSRFSRDGDVLSFPDETKKEIHVVVLSVTPLVNQE